MMKNINISFLFSFIFLNLFYTNADFFSEQLKNFCKEEALKEEDIYYWGNELFSGYTLQDIKDFEDEEILKPEFIVYCYVLLNNTEKYRWQYDSRKYQLALLLVRANECLDKNNIKQTLDWTSLSNEIYKDLSTYDKREALAQKSFYDIHKRYHEEDPQAPEQWDLDNPEYVKILSYVDNNCDVKNINTNDTFESAYQSLSESASSESND